MNCSLLSLHDNNNTKKKKKEKKTSTSRFGSQPLRSFHKFSQGSIVSFLFVVSPRLLVILRISQLQFIS